MHPHVQDRYRGRDLQVKTLRIEGKSDWHPVSCPLTCVSVGVTLAPHKETAWLDMAKTERTDRVRQVQ